MNDYLQLAGHTKPRSTVASKIKSKLKQKDEKPLDTLPHIGLEDDSGGFEDQPSVPKNYHEQQDNLRAFRTQLLNNRDVSYLGPIFLGSPKSQGAMVVYDTGSDWLTVKACLTDQHCNKKPDKKKTLEKIAKMGGDSEKAAEGLDDEEVQVEPEGEQETTEDEDPDNDGDGIMKPFSSAAKEAASKAMEMKPEMSVDAVYSANKSASGATVNNIAFPLSYGSADLQGFKYTDTVCLNPLDLTSAAKVTEKQLKANFCVKAFKYQAVMTSTGLEGCDGILGLSPKDYGTHSLIPSLKRGGMIDRQLISFSNAFAKSSFNYHSHPDDQSYMVFGGVNETQIEHGAKGLFSMPLADKDLNAAMYWGVEGQGFMYGDKFYHDPSKDAPILAVIDSGTTLCLIPYRSYEGLMAGIAKKVQDDKSVSFVCAHDPKTQALGACHFNNTRCEDITGRLEPMRFIFGGIVYEIKIQAFLKDIPPHGAATATASEKSKPGEKYGGACMFELRPSGTKDDEDASETRFLMGNTFLKNFVSVYDFDQQRVQLGVNIHSKGLVKAYKYRKAMFQK